VKKTVVILAIVMAFSAAKSFALTTTATQATNTLKGFNPTNKVKVYYVGNSSSNAWAAVSAHEGGDKEYWTSSAFGGLAYKTVTPGTSNGTNPTGAPSTPTDSSVPSSYTTM